MPSAKDIDRASSSIGRGTVIRGTVRGAGDIEIEGRVEGLVDVDGDVSLLDSARVRIEDGALTGRRVSVRGAVAGNIRGSAAIVLEQGARVVGDLAAPTIGIRPGGLLRGHVSTGEDLATSQATTARGQRSGRAATPAARPSAERRTPAAAASRPAARSTPATTQRTAEVAAPAPPLEAVAVTYTGRGRGAGAASAPAPVMPSLRKGQKGQMKRKNGK